MCSKSTTCSKYFDGPDSGLRLYPFRRGSGGGSLENGHGLLFFGPAPPRLTNRYHVLLPIKISNAFMHARPTRERRHARTRTTRAYTNKVLSNATVACLPGTGEPAQAPWPVSAAARRSFFPHRHVAQGIRSKSR